MHRWALTTGVMGFFALAIVAWLGGCSTFTCAVRGLAGGAAIYLVARFALRLLVGIVADTMVRARMSQQHRRERSSG